jgi:hypothetical protein
MDLNVELGSYTRESGLRLTWQTDYRLEVFSDGQEVVIRANEAGLRSLAQHLLTLALGHVPAGVHVHMEPGLELEDDSVSLVVEKFA